MSGESFPLFRPFHLKYGSTVGCMGERGRAFGVQDAGRSWGVKAEVGEDGLCLGNTSGKMTDAGCWRRGRGQVPGRRGRQSEGRRLLL